LTVLRLTWNDLSGGIRSDEPWTLVTGSRGLCDESVFATLDPEQLDCDWAASSGLTWDCGDEPLAAGDMHTFGTRAFAAGERSTVAFWRPPSATALWYALTGGALLCRSASLQRALRDVELPQARDADRTLLRLTRHGAMTGERCRVVPALLAVEDVAPEIRSLGSALGTPAGADRLARGVRASFANAQLHLAVAWARSLYRHADGDG
jgi:hypothetical protein